MTLKERNPWSTLPCLFNIPQGILGILGNVYKVPQGIPGALLTMSIYRIHGIPGVLRHVYMVCDVIQCCG
jgi:hypothetical protein